MKTDKIYKTPAIEITGMESESAFLNNSGNEGTPENGFIIPPFENGIDINQ